MALTTPSRAATEETYDLTVEAKAPVTLTRVAGGPKGPVLLVHGAGVSSRMFAVPTVRTNFVDFLAERGYDVWLLDWRASTVHPLRQFTLDEAAAHDMPAAVRRVREVTGASTVQAVVHCAGALTFLMAMGAGLLPDVRSVVASQVALHLDVPPASRLKARVGLAHTMSRFGIGWMSPAHDDGHRLVQAGLGAFTDAVHHECRSTFCHRLTFIYGHLYHHAQLNQATHDALPEQFGRCNILALRHLSQMIRAGHVAQFDDPGRGGATAPAPDYLDADRFRIPITLVSGARNRTWLPSSTERTYRWLVEANGPELYTRRVVDGYGHLDTFMGAQASEVTYPLMVRQLEAC